MRSRQSAPSRLNQLASASCHSISSSGRSAPPPHRPDPAEQQGGGRLVKGGKDFRVFVVVDAPRAEQVAEVVEAAQLLPDDPRLARGVVAEEHLVGDGAERVVAEAFPRR